MKRWGGNSLKVTTGDHAKHVQMSWLSRNRETAWQMKPSISSQQSDCFVAAFLFSPSRQNRHDTHVALCVCVCECVSPVSFQVNVEKHEIWALNNSIPAPKWLSGLKMWGERTVGDLASEESTCYATAYFLLHNAAVSEWEISPTTLFPLYQMPRPISSRRIYAYMLTSWLAI